MLGLRSSFKGVDLSVVFVSASKELPGFTAVETSDRGVLKSVGSGLSLSAEFGVKRGSGTGCMVEQLSWVS